MNRNLKDRVFDVPENILHKISQTVMHLNGNYAHGKDRAEKLLKDRKVKYGQLKKIIHELENMDKINDKLKYELAGGDLMKNWSKQHLQGERDMISNNKDSRKRADEIGAITGERKNSHLKSHSKKSSTFPSLNMMKSNSNKSSISPIISLGLFEQIEKFKKLINY
jgi:nitrous oxide reductase